MKNPRIARTSIFIMVILAASCAAHVFTFITVSGQGAPIQAPFDFDQFLSELESTLAKIEEEEKQQPAGGQASPSDGKGGADRTPQTTTSTGDTAQSTQPSTEKRDPESLFLDPAVITITPKGGQKRTEPTKDSINAYKSIMDEFTRHLSAIKNKINNIPRFSPSFKEEFSLFYQRIIDTIVIAHQQIKSRKAYQQLFLAPPEASKQLAGEMKKLRKMILDAAGKIRKLNEQLVIKAADEEAESAEALLRKLALQYQETDLPAAPEPIKPRSTATRPYQREEKKAQPEKIVLPSPAK